MYIFFKSCFKYFSGKKKKKKRTSPVFKWKSQNDEYIIPASGHLCIQSLTHEPSTAVVRISGKDRMMEGSHKRAIRGKQTISAGKQEAQTELGQSGQARWKCRKILSAWTSVTGAGVLTNRHMAWWGKTMHRFSVQITWTLMCDWMKWSGDKSHFHHHEFSTRADGESAFIHCVDGERWEGKCGGERMKT